MVVTWSVTGGSSGRGEKCLEYEVELVGLRVDWI